MESTRKTESYKKIKTLGSGAFGTAVLVKVESSNEYAVIKNIDIEAMSESEKKDTMKEAHVLRILCHPNIIRFREVYQTPKGKLCIVMDYADGKDLQNDVNKQNAKNEKKGSVTYWSEDQVLTIFTQICLAVKHVHDRKIIHRDLKAENIFLTKGGIVKLGDLGICRVLNSTKSKAKTAVGTPYYMSPEIINGQRYDRQSDIWSLGILLYMMCALKLPFQGNTLASIATKIKKGTYDPLPKQYSANLQNLLGSLLTIDPTKRPSINTVLKFPKIWAKVGALLNEKIYKEEFSHATKYGGNIFKQDQQRRKDKQTNEEVKAQIQNAHNEIRERFFASDDFTPVSGQDKAEFESNYVSFIGELHRFRSIEPLTLKSSLSFSQHDDVNLDGESDSNFGASVGGSTVDLDDLQRKDIDDALAGTGEFEMFNAAACEPEEFTKYMSKTFGEDTFKEGFDVIDKNYSIMLEDGGEEKIKGMLSHLKFNDDMALENFQNYCSTYLMVQKMNY